MKKIKIEKRSNHQIRDNKEPQQQLAQKANLRIKLK